MICSIEKPLKKENERGLPTYS